MAVSFYVDAGSPLQRLDPRPKFLLLVAVILLAVAGEHPLLPGTVVAFVLVGAQVGQAWRSVRRVQALLVVIFGVSVLVWSVFSQGVTPLFGPVEVESLLFGVSAGLKLAGTIVASVVWLSTTRNEEITTGFIRMGVPYRIAFAFSAALRMVPTLVGSMTTIMQAQRARGVDLETGTVFTRIRAHLPLVVPVFISALRSARHLAMALEAKGFGAQRERTYLLELRMRPIDWAVSGLAVVGMGAAIVVLAFDLARLGGLTR